MLVGEACRSISKDGGCHLCGISRLLKLDCEQIAYSHLFLFEAAVRPTLDMLLCVVDGPA